MKTVLRLLLLTLAAFLGSLFERPEAEAVSWKTAPGDFFCSTLEDAGENGPSAREQCRINGWLNYDTASGCTVAARTTVNNPVPDRLVRVIPEGTNTTTLGRTGASDVFVTAPADITGMNASQIARRLTIPESPTGFRIIEFPTPQSGLATPVFRPDPGFIGGGRTMGGAREFVIPNQPIPTDAIIRSVQ